jgi:hypothetical protein
MSSLLSPAYIAKPLAACALKTRMSLKQLARVDLVAVCKRDLIGVEGERGAWDFMQRL